MNKEILAEIANIIEHKDFCDMNKTEKNIAKLLEKDGYLIPLFDRDGDIRFYYKGDKE